MKTTDAFTKGQSLIGAILSKMDGLNEWRRRFICETFLLFLTIKGKVNFLQLARFGTYEESTFRNGFEKGFDFMVFNRMLIEEVCRKNPLLIVLDPTYIRKSGKKTPGLGYFYNGMAARYEKGLELGVIGVVDLEQQTAYHLEAVQSPYAKKEQLSNGQSLVDHYVQMVVERKSALSPISKYLVVDGYFAKRKFIEGVCSQTELQIISRLRDDANLRYLYNGPQKPGKGRPKTYDGKVNVQQIDRRRVRKEYEDDKIRISTANVNSIGLQMNIKLAYVEFKNASRQVTSFKIYFSTDLKLSAKSIFKYYQSRFQIEFLFRDAKGHTGLQACQARSKKKIHFHANASLTAVSLAKSIQRSSIQKNKPLSLSIADIKTEFFNRFLMKRIFSISAISENIQINDNMIRKILNFGKIAA